MLLSSMAENNLSVTKGQMQDESAPVSLDLFFVVLLIRKDFS